MILIKNKLHTFFSDIKYFTFFLIIWGILSTTVFFFNLIPAVNYIIIIWGLYIFLCQIVSVEGRENIKNKTGTAVLFMFTIFGLLTVIINFADMPWHNTRYFITNFIYMFVLFASNHRQNRKEISSYLMLAFICYTTVAVLSLISLLFNNYTFMNYKIGFASNYILTGITINTNFLGLIAFIGIITSFIYFINMKNNIKMLTLIIISDIILYICLVMSACRSAFYGFIVFSIAFVPVFFYMLTKKFSRKRTSRALLSITFVIVYFIAIFLMNVIIKKPIISLQEQIDSNTTNNLITTPEGIEDNHLFITLDKHYDNSLNVLTGRLDIWENAFIIYKQAPAFGVGNANVTERYEEIRSSPIIPNLHNGYIQILVANGYFGLLTFVGFAMIIATVSIKNYFIFFKLRSSKKSLIFWLIICLALVLCIINTVESKFLYTFSHLAIILWTSISYISNFDEKPEGYFSINYIKRIIKPTNNKNTKKS